MVTLFSVCTLLWAGLGVVWLRRTPPPHDQRRRVAGLLFAGPIVWVIALALLLAKLSEGAKS